MTTPENEVGRTNSPKKHFFKVPEGIQDFTDEQIYAFAEYMYDQFMEVSDQVQVRDTTKNSKEIGGVK